MAAHPQKPHQNNSYVGAKPLLFLLINKLWVWVSPTLFFTTYLLSRKVLFLVRRMVVLVMRVCRPSIMGVLFMLLMAHTYTPAKKQGQVHILFFLSPSASLWLNPPPQVPVGKKRLVCFVVGVVEMVEGVIVVTPSPPNNKNYTCVRASNLMQVTTNLYTVGRAPKVLPMYIMFA
jgi:hypothetical protein